MNTIIKSIILVLIISSTIVSQERNDIEYPYPKFIPYTVGSDTVKINFNLKEIDNIGKEQPARWLSVDPLADKYPGWSPYVYVRNNPLVLIDPRGMDDYYYNQDGSKKVVEYSWWHNLWNSDKYYYQGSEKAPNSFEGSKYWEVEKAVGDYLEAGKKMNLYENNFDINPWVKANLSEGLAPLNVSEVLDKSPQKAAWDQKRSLDPNGIYLLEGKGYLRDYIGNAIWGGIMSNALYPENISIAGAGVRQIWDALFQGSKVYPTNLKGFFDDPRDTEAILYGYKRATIWFR